MGISGEPPNVKRELLFPLCWSTYNTLTAFLFTQILFVPSSSVHHSAGLHCVIQNENRKSL